MAENKMAENKMEQVVAPPGTEFERDYFRQGYAQSRTDLILELLAELDELEAPDECQHGSDWTNGYNAGVSRMTKIFIKLMRGVKYGRE